MILFLQRLKGASRGLALEKASNLLGLDGVLEDPDLVSQTVQSALAVGHLATQVHCCAGKACSTSFSLLSTSISQADLSVSLTGRHVLSVMSARLLTAHLVEERCRKALSMFCKSLKIHVSMFW